MSVGACRADDTADRGMHNEDVVPCEASLARVPERHVWRQERDLSAFTRSSQNKAPVKSKLHFSHANLLVSSPAWCRAERHEPAPCANRNVLAVPDPHQLRCPQRTGRIARAPQLAMKGTVNRPCESSSTGHRLATTEGHSGAEERPRDADDAFSLEQPAGRSSTGRQHDDLCRCEPVVSDLRGHHRAPSRGRPHQAPAACARTAETAG